jgi:hypothetical protein
MRAQAFRSGRSEHRSPACRTQGGEGPSARLPLCPAGCQPGVTHGHDSMARDSRSRVLSTCNDGHPLRAEPDRPAASRPRYSAALGARERGGASCCGSRISTRPLPAGIRRGSSRTCAGSASTGTASLFQSERLRALRRRARPAEGAPAWSIPASAPAPTSPPRSLSAPHGDAAGRSIRAPAAPCPTIRERRAATSRMLAARQRQGARRGRPAALLSATATSRRRRARDIGDAILARKDAPASYHLACVVDDAPAASPGRARRDLYPSTPTSSGCSRRCSACRAAYLHHPLCRLHDDGRRLAKRDHGAPTLAAMRARRRRPARWRPSCAPASLPLDFARGA